MNDTTMFATMFSGIWGFIGLIFLIVGIVILKNRKKKEINCTSITYGKVKNIVRHQRYDSDGSYSYSWHPVFEYNIGGLNFIKESAYGSSQPKYAIGQDVKICYNPMNYNEFYVAGDTQSKTLGIIFILVGIACIVIAALSAILIL